MFFQGKGRSAYTSLHQLLSSQDHRKSLDITASQQFLPHLKNIMWLASDISTLGQGTNLSIDDTVSKGYQVRHKETYQLLVSSRFLGFHAIA